MTTPTPKITLYFLQASRSIRIAWLLEELHLPYESIFFPRENNKAPADFKEKSGSPLGKAPVLRDGELVLTESGAITEYLLETYDPTHRLSGTTPFLRARIRTFIHAAEGTFLVHALAILYARWHFPSSSRTRAQDLERLEKGLAINVIKDMDWLESELQGRRFLAGEEVSAADTMCMFGVRFIFERELCGGRGMGEWKNIEGWVGRCERTETWKRAIERTGHQL